MIFDGFNGKSRETLLKEKAQYGRPPRIKLVNFLLKTFLPLLQNKLHYEVNCTKPSPSVSVPATASGKNGPKLPFSYFQRKMKHKTRSKIFAQ